MASVIVSPKQLTNVARVVDDLRSRGRTEEAEAVSAVLRAAQIISEATWAYLTPSEAARRLGVPPSRIPSLVQQGLLAGEEVEGQLRIPVSAFAGFERFEAIFDRMDTEARPTEDEITAAVSRGREAWRKN